MTLIANKNDRCIVLLRLAILGCYLCLLTFMAGLGRQKNTSDLQKHFPGDKTRSPHWQVPCSRLHIPRCDVLVNSCFQFLGPWRIDWKERTRSTSVYDIARFLLHFLKLLIWVTSLICRCKTCVCVIHTVSGTTSIFTGFTNRAEVAQNTWQPAIIIIIIILPIVIGTVIRCMFHQHHHVDMPGILLLCCQPTGIIISICKTYTCLHSCMFLESIQDMCYVVCRCTDILPKKHSNIMRTHTEQRNLSWRPEDPQKEWFTTICLMLIMAASWLRLRRRWCRVIEGQWLLHKLLNFVGLL